MDPAPNSDLAELSAVEVLARAEAVVVARRAAAVEDLELCLAWADLHGVLPPDPPEWKGRRPDGAPRLVRPGGQGTPRVCDVALFELSAARGVHVNSTRAVLADALDLRHRLPRCWVVTRELGCEAWLARKIASMTRHLDPDRARLVDAAVAPALASAAPGRVLGICEAAIIHADPDTEADRATTRRRGRFAHVGASREDDGLRGFYARLDAGDAAWLDAVIDHVADLLATDVELRRYHHPELDDDVTKDELRAVALGWLARPHDLLAIAPHLFPTGHDAVHDEEPNGPAVHGTDHGEPAEPADPSDVGDVDDVEEVDLETLAGLENADTEDPTDVPADVPADVPRPWAGGLSSGCLARFGWTSDPPPPPAPRPLTRRLAPGRLGRVYVHLDPDALCEALIGTGGVAVVEQLGAMLVAQLRQLLGHAQVQLTPVIDLAQTGVRSGYTHGEVMAERAYLRARGEVFPHSNDTSRRLDADHPAPYQPGGPPGQTRDDNLAPLTRGAHRAKTFLGYTCHQLDLATWLWRTPHGLWRLVDHTGTHHLTDTEAHALRNSRDLQAALDSIRATHTG